jgi:predicted nucleotidyltransferase
MSLNNYGLYLVGSTMSGFALEGSDIDICLLTKPFSNEPRVDSLHHLNYLQQALLKNGNVFFKDSVFLNGAIVIFCCRSRKRSRIDNGKGSDFKI